MPIGLATNVLVDGARYLTGEYDNVQLAAALTVDTGATIATALVAGAITGALSGALVGGALGFGVGAVPAAIIGGLAGAIGALALSTIFNNTGAREYVVDEVADMYGNWTGQE
jgi:outer membrane lipoprotein SlyB